MSENFHVRNFSNLKFFKNPKITEESISNTHEFEISYVLRLFSNVTTTSIHEKTIPNILFYSLIPDSIIIFKRTVSYKNLTAKLRKYVYKRLFYSMNNFGFYSFAKVISVYFQSIFKIFYSKYLSTFFDFYF